MKKTAFRLVLAVMSIVMCAALAYAVERSEPVFTVSSDMADVAAEVLLDGDAYVNSFGASKAEKQRVLHMVQSYVDSVTSESQTPTVKGSVIHSGRSNEQVKLVLVRSDEAYTDDEIADLSAEAGSTVESINNFLVSKLSYDESCSEVSMTAKGALSTGKAVCAGYANAFSVLAERAGIKFVKVRGYIDDAYHVINVIEGGFAVDVTANADQNNRCLMISLEDYCDLFGFAPEINVSTAFELKYNQNNL